MKKQFSAIALLLMGALAGQAQVGVGTTSPNSTLDVRGSLSMNYRTVTAGTTLTGTDLVVVFTGTSAATITLPTAASITGRAYQVKNASTTTPTPVLTIATTASQTIDGLTSWTLTEANASLWLISDGTNWVVSSQSQPSSGGSAWLQGGNNVSALKTLGTTSNYDLSLITNNTEKMHIGTATNIGIGASDFDATNPETLLIAADSGTTNTVISATGYMNDYFQFNLQNFSNGGKASTDFVATANNGTDNSTYVDLGINSQGYSNGASNILNGSNTAYLYANAADFYIGNGATNKSLIFFTNTGTTGTATANGTDRMHITAAGNVGINASSPNATLDVNGSTGAAITVTGSNITLDGTNYTVVLNSGTPTVTLPAASGCARRIYVIVNQTAGTRTISAYRNFSNTSVTTVAANSSMTVQSDGTNWYRIQ